MSSKVRGDRVKLTAESLLRGIDPDSPRINEDDLADSSRNPLEFWLIKTSCLTAIIIAMSAKVVDFSNTSKPLKNITPWYVCASRNWLVQRYGFNANKFGYSKTLYIWYTFLGIPEPSRGGPFRITDVVLLDSFWLAQRVWRIEQETFKTALVKNQQSFEELIAQYSLIPRLEYLIKTPEPLRTHPVVIDRISLLAGEIDFNRLSLNEQTLQIIQHWS